MAEAQKVSPSTVYRVWTRHKLQPHRVESFKFSNDPQFALKVRDIMGLYVNPPDRADYRAKFRGRGPWKGKPGILGIAYLGFHLSFIGLYFLEHYLKPRQPDYLLISKTHPPRAVASLDDIPDLHTGSSFYPLLVLRPAYSSHSNTVRLVSLRKRTASIGIELRYDFQGKATWLRSDLYEGY